MKTMNSLALVGATLLAATSFGQTTPTTSTSTAPGTTTIYSTSAPSIRDNPGVLGHSYADFSYSWVDFDEDNASPRGFIAGVGGHAPVGRGLDLGLGYNYFRENNHRNPFNNSEFDVRSHQVTGSATFFAPMNGMKPFVTGAVGYKWSNGDLQSFRIFDDEWVWSAGVGVEIPVGAFALTPRVAYSDDFHGSVYSNAVWHYGAQAHHWFNEKLGGYVDVAFHDPHERFSAEYWTYTAGLRVRF
jgi:hypothetical protein